ncbi:MAG: PaaI family thioesterase [Hyphomonadaceae bacterium]|nr:PaaI family thioesterase [Hyphomonadaceae bacterium]
MTTDIVAALTERQKGRLPDYLGMEWLEARSGYIKGRFIVTPHHIAPNTYLHAASIVTLLDTACGYGCFISKPAEASGFTTVELKTNFLGTTREGEVVGEARMVHGGRTTQVWDAEAKHEGKTLALFRCTQMILYPK